MKLNQKCKLLCIIHFISIALQGCATSDTYIPSNQASDIIELYDDFEIDADGYLGQKYMIPAQSIRAVKENQKYRIYVAEKGYSTIAVYGTTSPPLGFCVPKDGSLEWKLFLNTCAGKLKALPNYTIVNK